MKIIQGGNLRPADLQELGQLVRARRQECKLTLDALAKATGISKPYLSNIENGATPGPPSPGKLALLERALDMPAASLAAAADWLRTPESIRRLLEADAPPAPRRADGAIDLDAMVAATARCKASGRAAKATGKFLPGVAGAAPGAAGQLVPLAPVPLINAVAAGPAAEFTDLDYPAGIAQGSVPAPAETAGEAPERQAALFALQISGDSMEPQYREGQIVVLSSARTARDGDDCLVRLDAAENFATTFKRVYFVSAGAPGTSGPESAGGAGAPGGPQHLRLVPLNPRHATRTVPLDQVTAICPAVWQIIAVPPAATPPAPPLSPERDDFLAHD